MTPTLSFSQSAALFDILTHYDTYAEIRDFRHPGSLKHYGPPFTAESSRVSTAPALQTLVSRFLLTLPGLKNLSDDFWKVQCYEIINQFELANLSESYDKGHMGSRKTLSTAISALIEYPVRGTCGGFAKVDDNHPAYDVTKAEDLGRAFRDFMDECIYGTVLDDLVKKAAETDDLNKHDPMIKAVHEFVLVNLASFMHYTLVLSPKGQYLLKLIDSANKLVPYMLVKQTLRIGNVASMINGLVKIGLAKMSVTSLTNWMGLTQNQDDGMNLVQHIISTVLHWDIKDLEHRASKLERERAKLGKDQLAALKDYAAMSEQQQQKIRSESESKSISIVTTILQKCKLESRLTDIHHEHALEYLSVQLSSRDRKEIIRVLCHGSPDHLTQSIRELVDAYEPVIRHAHKAIDLSGTVGDLECFLRDMIKLAKIQPTGHGETSVPTVGDFVQLLRKHQFATHTFIHQCCKNGPELTGWYLEWAKTAASQFKRESDPASHEKGAGDFTESLNELFAKLPPEKREAFVSILDMQTNFINEMHASSLSRLRSVLRCPPSKNPAISKILSAHGSRPSSRPPSRPASPHGNTHSPSIPQNDFHDPDAPTPSVSSDPGPGAYLARWQDLLDSTPITPSTQKGQLQKASSPQVVNASAVDTDGSRLVEFQSTEARGKKIKVDRQKPDVRVVIDAMGEDFRKLLAERSCNW